MKLPKNDLDLQTFQKLFSMTSSYIGKICVYFLKLPFVMKMQFYLSKIPKIKKIVPFCLGDLFVLFGGFLK